MSVKTGQAQVRQSPLHVVSAAAGPAGTSNEPVATAKVASRRIKRLMERRRKVVST